jgi:2-C-methyl-D-erythritol 2,4-cyclodiphosphate synthase
MMRIGQGLDVHAFSTDPARPLILGGVVIPGSPGLEGHSDADAATHALMDALLGAGGLGDLGRHFPDTDEANRGASSLALLDVVRERLGAAGFTPISADVTIVAETPRLTSHMGAMAEILSAKLGAPVSVKATTTEHLGALGRAEGIAALAVALIEAT